MTYILVFKTIDGREEEIDMGTSIKEEAIHIASKYVKGGEGIVEYAELSNDTENYKFSYSSCEWEPM